MGPRQRSHFALPPGSVSRAWRRRCARPRRPPASRAPWRAVAPRSSSTAGASRSSSASIWRRARVGRAGKWRDPRPCPHHPAGLPGPFPKKLGTQALLEPQQPALPSSERPRTPGPGQDASTESSEAPRSPSPEVLHGLVLLTSCGTLCLQVTLSSGVWVTRVTDHSQGSMSPCAPQPWGSMSSCAPVPGAHVTLCPHLYCPRH